MPRGIEEERAAVVWTTVGDVERARLLAREILERRLAACVSFVPHVRSLYRWKGSLEEEAEVALWIKTSSRHLDALRERLLATHPYELPEFLVLDVAGGSPAYLAWIFDETA
ncbi:MAG: divalent-cation tolerance protein CutA [Candidatus Eisenbacteria bacterium]|nr:divalent-cation tolerance protein CutA [Candidatus Eisenbacteria bacterium]